MPAIKCILIKGLQVNDLKFTRGQRRCGQRCLSCGDRAGHPVCSREAAARNAAEKIEAVYKYGMFSAHSTRAPRPSMSLFAMKGWKPKTSATTGEELAAAKAARDKQEERPTPSSSSSSQR